MSKFTRPLPLSRFPAKTVIFHERSPTSDVYLIRSGRVEIRKTIDGESVLIKALGPQEVFGEMALINKKPRSASATAVVDTECYVMSASEFEERLDSTDPFLRAIFRILGNTVRDATSQLAALKKMPPE
jgi:CRP/FNR family cyclic AMP-dependent transcriptional regulator